MEVNIICTPHIVWPQKENSLREEGGSLEPISNLSASGLVNKKMRYFI